MFYYDRPDGVTWYFVGTIGFFVCNFFYHQRRYFVLISDTSSSDNVEPSANTDK